MEEIKKVLVALAFSKDCEEIFHFGARLAENMNSKLIVASIINARDVDAVGKIVAMGYEVDGDDYVNSIKKERETALEQYTKSAGFPEEKVRFIVKVGHPVQDLIKIAVEENADLIVMGTRGRTEMEHFFTGSVAEKVFRRSPVTIVSYRSRTEAERLKKRLQS